MVAEPSQRYEEKRSPAPKPQVQNSFLKSILIFVIIASFSVLLLGGYWIFKDQAPRPEEVVTGQGEVLFTKEHLMGGQAVFQKYGLMDYGTVLGHGSYLGPDYTAEALKIYVDGMHQYYAQLDYQQDFSALSSSDQTVIKDKVIQEIKENRYQPEASQLVLTDAQIAGLEKVREHYRKVFTEGDGHGLLPGLIQESHMPASGRSYVSEGDQLTQISDFFFWTAWLSSTYRPNDDITYTNNWPYFEEAGNTMSYAAVWWSGVSVTVLILLLGVILFVHQRCKFDMEEAYEPGKFPIIKLEQLPLTPSQVKTGKYFTIVAVLLHLEDCLLTTTWSRIRFMDWIGLLRFYRSA